MSKKAEINVTRFVSRPKNTPFAPSWDYFMFEKNIKKINYKNFSKFLLSKEKEILELAPTKTSNKVTVGYTGLKENTTTARYGSYNVLSWKDKNVKILKDEIVKFHNQVLELFNYPQPKELYAQCWVNILKKGDQMKPHIHTVDPDCYLGGHLCVQCDDTTTNYINPINQICEPEIYYSKNEVGKITLFQNNIPHATSVQEKNKKRITLAFDLFTKNMNPNCVRLI